MAANRINGGASFILAAIITGSLSGTACRNSSHGSQGSEKGSVAVTSPTAGQVQRLLVSEGTRVEPGTPVLELATEGTPNASVTPVEDPEVSAAQNVRSADRAVDDARAEVVRHEANVQRLTPLVAGGQGTQAELDGARAEYELAQKRLQAAQDLAQSARTTLDLARNRGARPQIAPPPEAGTFQIRAPAAGILTVIGPRIGDRVSSGQVVATIRAD